MTGKQFNLLKKLKALADKGEDGEALNAQNKLEKLLLKYNISLSDLEEDKQKNYFFTLDDTWEIELFRQITGIVHYNLPIYAVNKEYLHEYKDIGNYTISCIPSEYILIDQMFEHFKPLLKKEIEVLFVAFCQANSLLLSLNDGESITFNDLTPEQQDMYHRANRMSKSIKSEAFLKKLDS